MPRFTETASAYLKRKMLARMPGFMLTQEDVTDVIEETGLTKEQVLKWATNLRLRYGQRPVDEVLAYLRGEEKVRDQCLDS